MVRALQSKGDGKYDLSMPCWTLSGENQNRKRKNKKNEEKKANIRKEELTYLFDALKNAQKKYTEDMREC